MTIANFRDELDLSGRIDSNDVMAARQHALGTLPWLRAAADIDLPLTGPAGIASIRNWPGEPVGYGLKDGVVSNSFSQQYSESFECFDLTGIPGVIPRKIQ